MSANEGPLMDAGGAGGQLRRGIVAQARAELLPEVRRLINESIGRIAVRAGGNLTAIGIRSALMFDPAATAVLDDPDHEQVIVPLSTGGGGPVLIASHVCTTTTEATITLSGVTDDYASLVLEGRVKFTGAASHGGANGRPLGLELNSLGSAPTLRYVLFRSGWVSGAAFQSVQASTSWPVNAAIVPGSDTNPEDWASFSHRFTAPRHTDALNPGDDLYHHFHGTSFYTASSDYLQINHSGGWGVYPHEPINSLKLYAYEGLATFEVGSEARLWGYPAS